jgi:hypothetical protein
MGDEYKVKKEVKYDVDTKGDTEKGLEDAGDKIKAGAKAFGKKVADPDKDLGDEYQKEKIKEKMD